MAGPSCPGVVKAVEVVSTPALSISEFFGTASSGDTRLSACVATVSEPCGQAYQVPEFDEYVLVTDGMVELTRGGKKNMIFKGQGALLKAGECVTWTWPQACQYMIVCLPGQDGEGTAPDSVVEDESRQQPQQPEPAAVEAAPVAGNFPVEDIAAPEQEPVSRLPQKEASAASSWDWNARVEESSGGASPAATFLEQREASGPPSVASSVLQEPEPMAAPAGKPPKAFGTMSNVPTEDQRSTEHGETTETEGGTNGAATPISPVNLPDYLTADQPDQNGMMQRASSLSAFEQMLDTEELNQLRKESEAQVQDVDRPARYGARHLNTPIVVVSSEINPWSKTGGLAMVAGSYAYEFAVRGHRTMAVAPCYGNYDKCNWVGKTRIWLNSGEHEVNYLHQRQEYGAGKGCDYIFVDHSCYKRPAGLYGDPAKGGEYEDNLFRFALLTLAAAEAPLVLNLGGSTYGQEVCFIANDWQTGLLPVYLKHKYKRHNTYNRTKCMYVLHNMGYQGKYRKAKFPCDSFLGLPPDASSDLQGEDMHYGNDCINLLGAGIRLADRVLTVSPNYAKEIQTPEGGQGLYDDLKMRAQRGALAGILNGISDEWNPFMDPHIARNFGIQEFEEGKAHNKSALQRELGLSQDRDSILIGFCGRLCYQKGVHLINEIIPWLMEDTGNRVTGRVQLIMMGKGEPTYEQQLRDSENKYRGKVCGYVGFKAEVEHRMMAGCDLLLMPSQYEPCGLPQMYAQVYGTLPVVHETGGLKDSVVGLWDERLDEATATGFLFGGFDANHLKERLYQAMNIFHHQKWLYRQMQRNAMAADYYWPQAIDEYEKQIDMTLEH